MTETDGRRHFWFRAFKYTIYCLLAYNVWLFFLEDLAASAQTFSGGVTLGNVVEAYSATIDTLAWVVLLLLFELETAVIPDEKLQQGGLKWLLSGVRLICYAFIVFAFYGYISKYGVITNVVPASIDDACALVGTNTTWLLSLDDYPALTMDACEAMQGQTLYRVSGTSIIGTADQMSLGRTLALTDIINAGDWLIIVALLEVEVWLQLKDLLTDRLLATGKFVKGILYAVLFACATYWGIDGDFLDFWDAFLWLVAFLFIELNIFQWHAETGPEDSSQVS